VTYLESIITEQYLNETYPHCDPRVLHAPSECEYCDMHANWQQERLQSGVLFTNDERNKPLIEAFLTTGRFEGDLLPCPGMLARGDAIKLWGGNVAKRAHG
jgi:hypothetical protein